MPTPTDPATLLTEITHALANLNAAIPNIQAEIARLTALGVYDAVPRQVWEDRNGHDYLYLLFPSNPAGGYYGPNGNRKIYIGRDRFAIAKTEQTIARTNQLITVHNDLDLLIAHRRRLLSELMSVHITATHPPRLSGPIHYQ